MQLKDRVALITGAGRESDGPSRWATREREHDWHYQLAV